MRFFIPSLFIIISLGLIKCQSPADQINKAFKEVNHSLATSNQHISSLNDSVYASITANRGKNEDFALKADTLFYVAVDADKFLDSLKETLHQKDTTGENVDLAMKVLTEPVISDMLEKKLSVVYSCSLSSLVDGAKKRTLDSMMSTIRGIQPGIDWKKFYFEKTPTVAAMTILAKFRNDCDNGTAFVLTDINNHLLR